MIQFAENARTARPARIFHEFFGLGLTDLNHII